MRPGCPVVNPLSTEGLTFVSHPLLSDSTMVEPRLMALAAKIDALIKASSYSQKEIAIHLGLDKSAITKWIKGERTPTMKNLIELADLLGVDMREIWEGPHALPATPEQRLMMDMMKDLTPEAQQMLLANAKLLKREV